MKHGLPPVRERPARPRRSRALKPEAPFPAAWVRTVPLRGAAKAVLNALACFADRRGQCFPGQERLAVASGFNQRTVRKVLRKIEVARWITIESRGRNRTPLYTLALHRTDHMEAAARLVLGPCTRRVGAEPSSGQVRNLVPVGAEPSSGQVRNLVPPKSTRKYTGEGKEERSRIRPARGQQPMATPPRTLPAKRFKWG